MYHDHPLVERKRCVESVKPPNIKKLTRAIYFTGIMFIISLLDLMMNLAQFEQLCQLPIT